MYIEAGQLVGFIYGWPGAAMYEILSDRPGLAGTGSTTISVAYLSLLAAIAICNISYIARRMRGTEI